jgi:predicted HTH transcriptional regulator
MNTEELDKIIQIGEGFTSEFKKSPSHIGRELCAFANASGGHILIGVDDNGNKVGVKSPNRTKSRIQNTARDMDPPLALDIEMVDDILVVTVPSGPNKPHSANGIFYIREAANCEQMNRDEIRESGKPCMPTTLNRPSSKPMKHGFRLPFGGSPYMVSLKNSIQKKQLILPHPKNNMRE